MQDRKEQAKAEVARLVEKYRWERQLDQSESDIRADYIDLLFLALGWNVYNDPGKNTNYRREGYIRGAGFVDVGLEIDQRAVLLLEAKRFGVIAERAKRTGDRTPEEKQAFRYSRGKGIRYAILVNFERLHLFNADHERLIAAFDQPDDYLERFDELWRLTPEEISKGSMAWWEGQLEKADVDLAFLASLRRWRLLLANAIYEGNAANPALLTNGAFDFEKLMAAVQRILDRLILIRYGDDKEVLLAHDLLENIIEGFKRRGAYAGQDYLTREFIELCHRMDEQHNTTIFAPGHVCEQVIIPNETLETLIDEMSRISFRKFTSDILGNTYESYLSTKLKLVNGQILDEERMDVRKGKGIYYTPSWVVDYIVDKTLGERLRELEKEHGLHGIEKVRGLAVLDPACGSGSFLIKAYHVLADFYRRMNEAIVQEQERLASSIAGPEVFMMLERIARLPQQVMDYPQVILQEHLFGVDLDPEAAELATVNLTMQAFADSRKKKLPKILNENIKVGNSLISGTEEELNQHFGEGWRDTQPFNWAQEFPAVREHGGFDVVVGNPPYGASMTASEQAYYGVSYSSFAATGDVYTCFVQKGLLLSKEGGAVSFVVPSAWLGGPAYRRIRETLLDAAIQYVVLLPFDVFPDAYVDTVIFVAHKEFPKDEHPVRTYVFPKRAQLPATGFQPEMYKIVHQSTWRQADDQKFVLVPEALGMITRLRSDCSRTLRDAVLMRRGVLFDRKLLTDTALSDQSFPYFEGDIYRYVVDLRTPHWIEFGSDLKERPKETKWFVGPRILVRRLVNRRQRIMAAFSTERFINNKNLYVMLTKDSRFPDFLILGLVNSRLISYLYVQQVSQATKDDFPQITIKDFLNLPLPNEENIEKHGTKLVSLVERMLELHKRTEPLGGHDLLTGIERVDSEIDVVVYELYGLTEAERRLVEGG